MKTFIPILLLLLGACAENEPVLETPKNTTPTITHTVDGDLREGCERIGFGDLLSCHDRKIPEKYHSELLTIFKDCFPEALGIQNIKDMTAGSTSYWIERTDGSEALAILSVFEDRHFVPVKGGRAMILPAGAGIYNVCVAKNHRGKKLGETLLDFTLNQYHAKNPENRYAYLEVWEDNSPALGLYTKCGFKNMGKAEAQWRDLPAPGRKISPIIMQRDLLVEPLSCKGP